MADGFSGLGETKQAIDAHWIDLDIHEPVWRCLEEWVSPNSAMGTVQITGDSGVGKSFLIQTLKKRFRSERLRVLSACFPKGQKVNRKRILQHWLLTAANFEDLPFKSVEETFGLDTKQLENWLQIAIDSLEYEGYRVRMTLEADQAQKDAVELLESYSSLFLNRSRFGGITDGQLVLPPWSESELTRILTRKWPESDWSEDKVSSIWIAARGIPRQCIAEARNSIKIKRSDQFVA